MSEPSDELREQLDEKLDEKPPMTIGEAWALVDLGKIQGEWRRWVAVDGREFHWHDLDSRREALIAAAEHVASL
jgi:hypothetical protein